MDDLDPTEPSSDDLLAQHTRRRLFALLRATGGAASTEELAARLGLHANGVRAHLQRMSEAGLLIRRRVPRPRGRPRDEWALSPAARPAADPPSAYRALAGWLARTIPATSARLGEVEATGRQIGRELAPTTAGSPRLAIGDALTALGFQPEITDGPPPRLSYRLRNCPYRDSVRENQAVVCALHRGLTLGLLDRLAPTAALERFVPHDPDRAGCEIDIEGLAASPS